MVWMSHIIHQYCRMTHLINHVSGGALTNIYVYDIIFASAPYVSQYNRFILNYTSSNRMCSIPQTYYVTDPVWSCNSNMTSFFRFVDKRVIYRWYNLIRTCADECDWLFHWQHKLCDIFRERKYKLPSSNQSILPYLYS